MADMRKFEELKSNVLRHGGFFVHFYFDMHSDKIDNLQEMMVGFTSKLTNEPGVKMAVAEIEAPLEREGTFSTTAKVSMLISDFSTLLRLTMSYTPIGIDIEEPLDARIDAGEMQNALMNISATSQELTHHILSKSMSEEERKKFVKQMSNKAELGKRIKEMSDDSKDKKK
ncbi:MAG: hypothetical protein WC492_01170 [Candidatus Micrarchaeia archaeon]